jgi:hypothetical protein
MSEAKVTFSHVNSVAIDVASYSFLVAILPITMVSNPVLIDVPATSIASVIPVLTHVNLPNAVMISAKSFYVSVFPFSFIAITILVIERSISFPLS